MQELVGYVEKAQYPEDDPAPWQNEDLIAYVSTPSSRGQGL